LAALNLHPRTATQILPHGRIALTTEIYAPVPDAATRAALRRLSDAIDQAAAASAALDGEAEEPPGMAAGE
jgi:hypothetical protein